MKLLWRFGWLCAGLSLASISLAATAKEPVLEVVRNLTRVKILESNNVSLRPGSVYENVTIFESIFSWAHPKFNYEFVDSGLGTAEPLYPLYQKGNQHSWGQVIPAFFSERSRHIEHFTTMTTPEGCLVNGLYMLRHISEYPDTMFKQERAEGYEQIVLRLESYTRVRPDAQCGRHASHAPDPDFDANAFLKRYRSAMSFAELPQADLERFEWKLSAIHHFTEERNRKKWPRFDQAKLANNSLWYYPEGHALDFGLDQPRVQPGLRSLRLPRQLLVQATPELREALPLSALVKPAEFAQLMNFLQGRPVPDYASSDEPGADMLRLSDVTPHNIYTSGLALEPIRDVVGDVTDMRHYALVAMTIRPFEPEEEVVDPHAAPVPQIRFVYQLMDPRHPGRPLEQLYYHLKFDAVDRTAAQPARDAQHRHFLQKVDELTASQESGDPGYATQLQDFVREFTARPVQGIAFSSSLTGLWTFGSLDRDRSAASALTPLRIVREGIDLGYYSSIYDNDLFRAELARSPSVDRRADMQRHLDDLLPKMYRDPLRQNTSALTFNRMSCAQCHQTAGRDGVHIALNDGIDRRYTETVKASEYFMHEADRQLEVGQGYWKPALNTALTGR